MKKEKPYITWLKWILTIVVFLGIFKFSLDFLQIKDYRPSSISGKILMNVGIFLIIFVALGAHELGHLVMGLKNGFRFELFVVGFLGVKRNEQKIELYFNTDFNYFGGVALTSPTKEDEKNAIKFAQVILAGPIASILFAVFCIILTPIIGGAFGVVLYVGSLISLGLFIVTTLPSRTGMFFTDRKRYQRLVKPGKDQQIELAIIRIMGRLSSDKSYKNIDEKDLTLLISDDLPFFKFYGLFNLICYQLEMNKVAEEEVLNEYELLSGKMPKKLKASFDKEIELFKGNL